MTASGIFRERRQRARAVGVAARVEGRDHDLWLSPHGADAIRAGAGDFSRSARTLTTVGAAEVRVSADRASWLARLARSLSVKRSFDVVASMFLLASLLPVLFLIAAAIRWDSAGPMLITQNRNGLNKREFRIFKFRTMTVVEDGHTAVQCRKADPRVTRVGAFLRRSSLDELPQLLNVLKGEMSLVGPRPHAVKHDREFGRHIPGYERRFAAVPGITGLAQVRGFRGPIETRAQIWNRVVADVEYVEDRTVIGDLGILLRTVSVVFRSARRA